METLAILFLQNIVVTVISYLIFIFSNRKKLKKVKNPIANYVIVYIFYSILFLIFSLILILIVGIIGVQFKIDLTPTTGIIMGGAAIIVYFGVLIIVTRILLPLFFSKFDLFKPLESNSIADHLID